MFPLRLATSDKGPAIPCESTRGPASIGMKIGVATPTRDDVNMEMIRYPRARAFADVDPDVESLSFHHLPQQFLPAHHEREKFGNFILAEIAQLTHFSIRHRHQMPNGVGVSIHDEEGTSFGAAQQDEQHHRWARAASAEEIGRTRFLEVF